MKLDSAVIEKNQNKVHSEANDLKKDELIKTLSKENLLQRQLNSKLESQIAI